MTPHDVNRDSSSREARAEQRAVWTSARGWIDGASIDDETSVVTDRLLAHARICDGDAVLDVACGAGDPAFAIARLVGPRGRVIAVDITPAMTDAARALARQAGLTNVEFRSIDSEMDLPVEGLVFDAVTARYGLMYMPDPAGAVRAWRATLRPGGRVAVSTWMSLPIIDFVLDTVREHATVREPRPNDPGIFALADAEVLARTLRAAGLRDVDVERVPTQSFEELPAHEWWDMMARTAGPLVRVLESLPKHTRDAIRADGIRALGLRHPNGIVAERGIALVASGVNVADDASVT